MAEEQVAPPGYSRPTSAEELLERYAAGERWFADAQLLYVDFVALHMRRCFEACRAILESGGHVTPSTYTDLRGAVLCRAKLCGADLSLVDLSGANLRGADLRSATLPNHRPSSSKS